MTKQTVAGVKMALESKPNRPPRARARWLPHALAAHEARNQPDGRRSSAALADLPGHALMLSAVVRAPIYRGTNAAIASGSRCDALRDGHVRFAALFAPAERGEAQHARLRRDHRRHEHRAHH